MKQLIFSIRHAWRGIRSFIASERNGRIQLTVSLLTIILGTVFGIPSEQWLILLICIGLVLSLECINSAVEHLADIVQPEFDVRVKVLKDLLAGAVLMASVISLIIGVIIFLPVIKQFLLK